MTVEELRTELLPRSERLATWQRRLSHALAPVDVHTPHAPDFRASLRLVDLGAVRVATTTSPPLEARQRTITERPDGSGHYAMVLNRTGDVVVADEYRTVALAPGELTFCDPSRPFTVRMAAPKPSPQDRVATVTALIPQRLLPMRRGHVEQHLLTGLGADQPMVSVLSRHLHDVVRYASHWRPTDLARLATATVDLVAALLFPASAPDGSSATEPVRQQLQNRIHSYIQRNLGSPGLSPSEVAAAHGISLRHLHQLFREQELTIAAWIRQCRLERCCRDLADADQLATPVHTIATRWGFPDAAHFSKVFRRAYGIPPTEYRKALTAHAPHPAHACATDAHALPTTS
ncbi:helix-turn-helix domain-containing protein [Streptomyces prasinosporus]|uniref:Helix-turn-helix domain-containing protein n=1 Tax=Streptomyces prasinosporus TaxID=68256 RepID=A0ABP6TYT1_9ACTN